MDVLLKYLRQLAIILGITFLGEVLHSLIPYPIPASIYGLVLMLLCLCLGLVRVEDVKEVSRFLIGIMSIMFVPAAVGIMDCASVLSRNWLQYLVIITVSYLAVFLVSGLVTQLLKRRKEGHDA